MSVSLFSPLACHTLVHNTSHMHARILPTSAHNLIRLLSDEVISLTSRKKNYPQLYQFNNPETCSPPLRTNWCAQVC
jgi:hypothetical protein